MPNKTPSYKDKVMSDFDEKFGKTDPETINDEENPSSLRGSRRAGCDDCAINIEIREEHKQFLSQALEEQMKLTIECLPDTDYVMMLKVYQDKFKKNLKSKGLI